MMKSLSSIIFICQIFYSCQDRKNEIEPKPKIFAANIHLDNCISLGSNSKWNGPMRKIHLDFENHNLELVIPDFINVENKFSTNKQKVICYNCDSLRKSLNDGKTFRSNIDERILDISISEFDYSKENPNLCSFAEYVNLVYFQRSPKVSLEIKQNDFDFILFKNFSSNKYNNIDYLSESTRFILGFRGNTSFLFFEATYSDINSAGNNNLINNIITSILISEKGTNI